jgi:predicted metal-dependent enzyme (double-stranded beta helix superfamily)
MPKGRGVPMAPFDKDQFVADCVDAVRSADRANKQVKELVDRAVSDPSEISAEVGDVTQDPMTTIWHRSDELTVLHIVWPPEVELFPHDHNMWAVIGIYGGREDNQFYRRIEDGRIEPHTGRTIVEQDVIGLGSDVVHSVANPTREWTAALHVYGGDFYSTPRTMWSGETLEPLVLDTDLIEKTLSAAAAQARTADVPGERP